MATDYSAAVCLAIALKFDLVHCGNQGQLVAVVSWTLTVGACAAAQANVRQRT